MDGAELPLPQSPEGILRTPSPRRRYTVGQDSRDWSFTPSTPPVKQTGYDDVVRLLDTVASATLEEKTLIDTYETQIRELQMKNAELLNDKEELLQLLRRDLPPTTQADKALAEVRALQDLLAREREGFATREADLTTRIFGLETAVTDSLRDLLQERRFREQIEWQASRGRDKEDSMSMNISMNASTIPDNPECAACKARETEGQNEDEDEETSTIPDDLECAECKARETEGQNEDVEELMLKSMEAVTRELHMNEDMKIEAEEKLEVASGEIQQLKQEVKALSMLKKHKEDTESELDMLKEGMKRIERIAMMYGPLEDELGLLDAIETWKLEFLAVSTKRKKRRKKEEKHGLG